MNIRKTIILAAILLFFVGIVVIGINYEKLTDTNDRFAAQIINEDNRKLIGTEVSGGMSVILSPLEGLENKNESVAASSVLKDFRVCDDAVVPDSVTKFPTDEGKTPEVLFTNGACIIFTKEDGEGWECKPGDTLSLSYEKYPAGTVEDQQFIIGCIQDETFRGGELFSEMSGAYDAEIREEGEYFLYVISAASDYLALKEGVIEVL